MDNNLLSRYLFAPFSCLLLSSAFTLSFPILISLSLSFAGRGGGEKEGVCRYFLVSGYSSFANLASCLSVSFLLNVDKTRPILQVCHKDKTLN